MFVIEVCFLVFWGFLCCFGCVFVGCVLFDFVVCGLDLICFLICLGWFAFWDYLIVLLLC